MLQISKGLYDIVSTVYMSVYKDAYNYIIAISKIYQNNR
jgi:hypothetical protein